MRRKGTIPDMPAEEPEEELKLEPVLEEEPGPVPIVDMVDAGP